MNRSWLICLMMMLVTTCWPQNALVSLDSGQSYEMTWNKDHWVARIYVTPVPGHGSDLSATLRQVSLGSQTAPQYLTDFRIERFSATGELIAFDLLSSKNPDLPHGTYNVAIRFSDGKSEDSKTLQATLPAAVLQTQPLQITNSIPWFVFSHREEKTPPLHIRETGGKSYADMQVTQLDALTADGETFDGKIVFPSGLHLDPKKLSGDWTYSLSGEFPVGTSKANLIVTSDQIEAPVTIPVEVRTRRSKAVLLLWVLFGLLLGFLTRGVVKQRIELGLARQKALEQVKELQAEIDRTPDLEFRGKVNGAIRKLVKKIEDATVLQNDALKKATEGAAADLADAEKDLNSSATKLQPELDGARQLVRTGFALPIELQTPLDDAREAVTRLAELLRQRNPTAAAEGLTSTVASLVKALGEAGPAWKIEVEAFIKEMQEPAKLLLDGDSFKNVMNDVLEAATTTAIPAVGAGVPEIHKYLEAVDSLIHKANFALLWLKPHIAASFAAMNAILQNDHLPMRTLWNLGAQHTAEFVAAFVTDIRLASPGSLEQSAHALREEWRRALVAQKAPGTAVKSFDAGDYKAAAQIVHEHLAPVKATSQREVLGESKKIILPEDVADVNLSDATEEEAADFFRNPFVLFSRQIRPPNRPGIMPSSMDQTPSPIVIQALKTRSLAQLYLAQLAMGIVSTIGLAVIGYFLFESTWFGTGGDMLKAFLWGFTTDIGVDAIMTAAKSKPA